MTVANPAVFTADDMEQGIRFFARFTIDLIRAEPINDSSFEEMMRNYPPEMREKAEELVRGVLRAVQAVPARAVAQRFIWNPGMVHDLEQIGRMSAGGDHVPEHAEPLPPSSFAIWDSTLNPGPRRVRVISSFAYTTRIATRTLDPRFPPTLVVWTHELTPDNAAPNS